VHKELLKVSIMNSHLKSRQLLSALVIAIGAVGLDTQVHAQERHDLRGPRVVLDARYHHDRYYPPRGFVMEHLPVGSVAVSFGPAQYFFHAGVWFRPVGARFEVITPPIGIVVPLLPPGYVSLTIGGLPYYYANGVYYVPASGTGYTVVAPPAGAETAQADDPHAAGAGPAMAAAPSAAPASASVVAPIVYPRNGQTAAQAELDQSQCRAWAAAQPGVSGNPSASVFDRALDACLDGRGYTVR